MTKNEALRLALEALEGVLDDSSKVLDASISGGLYEVVQCRDAITAIKAALESKDEPSMKVEGPLHVICQCDKCKPQIAFNAEVVGYVALQRTWVGLTDEDLKLLSAEWRIVYGAWMDDFARDIEARLKDLNT
jgi:hypothetical protein